ncbi:integrin alpha N-terminal domain-containing protein [Gigaspora margarita]|uniref:Integrin alpha N-terminal domain-containing protein n=1 Tax=Gigaspora margarita TaxID=4874 RepID=A0A8H3ZVM7_GIGMA|nr:integrin alpha N-terminal domain-containing protein [Gigaspora margarita]
MSSKLIKTLATFFVYSALFIFHNEAITWFQTARYTANSLYSVDNIGLKGINGTVVAFADFNSDKYTDLIILSSDQTAISIYLWDHASYSFNKEPSADITISTDGNNAGFLITNVLPGDYNYDGILDVLIMGQVSPGDSSKQLYMRVYMGSGNHTFDPNYYNVPSSTAQQPIPLDFYGSMKVDLLGHQFGDSSHISIWKNVFNETSRTLFDVVQMPVNGSVQNCTISDPHSNAFIDLNGDCLADLFLTCRESSSAPLTYQIWTNIKGGFTFSRSGNLPDGTGQISFADMDGDGTIDMVYPVCSGGTCKIHIAYNKQIPLCTSSGGSVCRHSSNLCLADGNFSINIQTSSSETYSIIDISSELPDDGTILTTDTTLKGNLPIPIRIGDYNFDGYPDILVISSSGSTYRASLFQSELCTPQRCSSIEVSSQRRIFTRVTDGASPLNDITDARSATFMDLDEDGTLDILVLKSATSSNRINVIHNNYFNDAFFLKALMLNGVADKQGYGVSYSGASYKFTILDTSGVKRANQVAQYPQSAYQALQLPYSLFGLGRTNNYVDLLFAGSTRNQTFYYTSYSGVIPNSQLIVVPYQPPGVFDPSTWSLELFIHPGDWIPWVLLVLIISTIVMAIIVVILSWMEKREDRLTQQREQHKIHFGAL